MASEITCNHCGTLNPVTESFCENCGALLYATMPVTSTQPPPTQSTRAPGPIVLKQRYRVLHSLGSGGFGTVYKVEDMQLSNRPLAAKKLDLNAIAPKDHQAAISSFKQEATLLATLQHPNLPRIYEHFTEKNENYMIMDFIEGETLEEHLKKLKRPVLAVPEVVRIAMQLAIVLDYLHTRRPAIIFRDLKPANIMLTLRQEVYLIDFGIARHFKPGQSGDTTQWGTREYAAPEQLKGRQTSEYSDIYSLGVVLHELLTGEEPGYPPTFAPPTLTGTAQTKLGKLVMHMLKSDKANRPANMALVKQQLQSIANELQQPARTSGAGTKAAPAAPKKPGIAQNARAQQAVSTKPPAQQAAPNMPIQQAAPTKAPPTVILAGVAPRVQGELCHSYAHASRKIHALAWSPDGRSLAAAGEEPEQIYIWQALTQQAFSAYTVHARLIKALAWSPDSRRLVSGGNDRVARVWQPGKSTQQAYTGHTGWIQTLAWSPDGRLIASGGADEQVHLWEATSAQPRLVYRGHPGTVLAVAFAPDGTRVASADERGFIQMWEVTSGHALTTCVGHTKEVSALAWSPDSRLIVSGSQDRTARVWEASNGQCLTTYAQHQRMITAVAWSAATGRIASASADKSVQIWNPQNGDTLYTYRGHNNIVNALAWSPDGNYLASAGESETVHVWWAV